MLGRFVDASWAYRFGPPAQDVIVATLEAEGTVISQATIFPATLVLRARRLVHRVRLSGSSGEASHATFSLEPGVDRTLPLSTLMGAESTVAVTALNMRGRFLVQP